MSNIIFTNIAIDVTIGIDLGSFNVIKNQPFKGIVNIPHINGTDLHVIHFQHVIKENHDGDSDGTNDGAWLRYGYWFTRGNYYVVYNENQELYEIFQENDAIKYELVMKEYISRNMVSEYPKIDEENRWEILSDKINWSIVKSIIIPEKENNFVYVDSSMTTLEENDLLHRTLIKDGHFDDNENNNNNNNNNNLNDIFHYTRIKFKSKEAIRDNYKMEDFQDKSFYFNEIIINKKFSGEKNNFIGELQFSFLNSILFGNYGSSLQWHNMIELICQSSNINKNFIKFLDNILSVEINLIPNDYKDILINEKLWISLFKESFQKDNLPKTHSMLIKHHIIETETQHEQEQEQEQDDEIDEINYDEDEETEYHRLDSSEDEDGPTIVQGIYYG
ncbi:similar to Saccharomyces cerevisiae YBL074C AAR2 Component of the U5 snRNP, required for splicing of U3 precursors [Maudiozyma saulgeensis]|uniref:Similar to Saccharomyces cerevisiae YBL074C AAR2 Component of the U5 snRNP, required for splicing of U3s n=1 Tax=Maudiozyma saulgeensis TaxID=1789683 RepID=A0A1X7QYH2_9SACH|nr:similar to Saccharomyces cerevisiae YBL074C AAR2 Component of the U5 snRNP, required for splicing of U3 precursors [Kazachstania saulgeensis]